MFSIKKPDKPLARKLLYYLAAAVFMASSVLAWLALATPDKLEKIIVENNVRQKTMMDYSAETVKCMLYPNGGIIKPEGALIQKIVKTLIFHVQSYVETDKDVSVSGKSEVEAVLVAENLWERSFPMKQKTEFNIKGKSNKIIDSNFNLEISEIQNFIKGVEEETGTQPNRYFLKLQPKIEGSIQYNESTIAIEPIAPLVLDLSGNLIKKMADGSEEKDAVGTFTEINKETSLTNRQVIDQYLKVLGINVPVVPARYAFILIAVLTAGILAAPFIHIINEKLKRLTEVQKIDKKYNKRIYTLQLHKDSIYKHKFKLNRFNDLIKLSESKELPIFKAEESEDTVAYMVIDGDDIFSFSAHNYIQNNQEIKIST